MFGFFKSKPTRIMLLTDIHNRMQNLLYAYAPYTRASLPLFAAVMAPGAAEWRIYSKYSTNIKFGLDVLDKGGIKEIEIPDRVFNNLNDELGCIEKALYKTVKNLEKKSSYRFPECEIF